MTDKLTFSFGDDVPEQTDDWLGRPDAVFLYYLERMAGVYSGTPEAHTIRNEITQSPVVQSIAEEILEIVCTELTWTHALMRSGCRRAIEVRKRKEEEVSAAERIHIQDKWGIF